MSFKHTEISSADVPLTGLHRPFRMLKLSYTSGLGVMPRVKFLYSPAAQRACKLAQFKTTRSGKSQMYRLSGSGFQGLA